MLSDAIITFLIATCGAVAGLFIRYLYYSKCDVVKCGCLEFHRSIKSEEKQNPEDHVGP